VCFSLFIMSKNFFVVSYLNSFFHQIFHNCISFELERFLHEYWQIAFVLAFKTLLKAHYQPINVLNYLHLLSVILDGLKRIICPYHRVKVERKCQNIQIQVHIRKLLELSISQLNYLAPNRLKFPGRMYWLMFVLVQD
jgi:hypothetical protein